MKDGSTAMSEVKWWADPNDHSDGRATVRVTLAGQSDEKTAFDFYKAFQDARAVFEAEGCRFLCYGASLNVWPSGMARDMGIGLKAYRLHKDRNTSLDDLVPIFESGEDITPSTVEEQCL